MAYLQIFNNPWYDGVEELFDGRDSTPMDMDGHRTYTRRFLVKVKSQYIDAARVVKCPGLPILNSFYVPQDMVGPGPGEFTTPDLLALARQFDAKPLNADDWQFWVVTITYTTHMPSSGPTGPETQDHPELEYPDVDYDFEIVQYAPQKDLTGKPFVNSADMPFSPPFTIEVAYPILSITRNELDFNRSRASAYAFAINSDKFLGADPGTVMCMPPKAKQWWRGKKRYWKVSYKLRFAPQQLTVDGTNPLKSFDPLQVLDAGTHEFVQTVVDSHSEGIFYNLPGHDAPTPAWDLGTNKQAEKDVIDFAFDEVDEQGKKKRKPIFKFGQMVSHPVLLDGFGHENVNRNYDFQLNVFGPDKVFQPVAVKWGNLEPVYRQFNVYRKKSFNDLLSQGLGGPLVP